MITIRRSLTSDGEEEPTWRSRSRAKHAGEARSTPLESVIVEGAQDRLGVTGFKWLGRDVRFEEDYHDRRRRIKNR